MSVSSESIQDHLWNVPLGELARSIVSCPEAFELVVEGVPLLDPGILHGVGNTGIIRLLSTPDSDLTRCATIAPPALMYLDSGLHDWRHHSLAIVGELHLMGDNTHTDGVSDAAYVEIDLVPSRVVMMGPIGQSTLGERGESEVPLPEFRSRAHELNAGYLQRAAEHANRCHQQDLRRTIAKGLGCQITDIGGVEIHHINRRSAYVDWLDSAGATRRLVQFSRPAATPDDLANLLIEQLKLIGDAAHHGGG